MRPLCNLPGDRNARRQELSRVLAVAELESQPVRDGQLIDTPAGSAKQGKQLSQVLSRREDKRRQRVKCSSKISDLPV
jgi:hypothetical protein